jgi:hypothetical protein
VRRSILVVFLLGCPDAPKVEVDLQSLVGTVGFDSPPEDTAGVDDADPADLDADGAPDDGFSDTDGSSDDDGAPDDGPPDDGPPDDGPPDDGPPDDGPPDDGPPDDGPPDDGPPDDGPPDDGPPDDGPPDDGPPDDGPPDDGPPDDDDDVAVWPFPGTYPGSLSMSDYSLGEWCIGTMDVTVSDDGSISGDGFCDWDLTDTEYSYWGSGTADITFSGALNSAGAIEDGFLDVDTTYPGASDFRGEVDGLHSEDSTVVEMFFDWYYSQTITYERY